LELGQPWRVADQAVSSFGYLPTSTTPKNHDDLACGYCSTVPAAKARTPEIHGSSSRSQSKMNPGSTSPVPRSCAGGGSMFTRGFPEPQPASCRGPPRNWADAAPRQMGTAAAAGLSGRGNRGDQGGSVPAPAQPQDYENRQANPGESGTENQNHRGDRIHG
jgi:hypothetical protein